MQHPNTSRSRIVLFAAFIAVPVVLLLASWVQHAVPLIKLYRDTFMLAGAPPYLGLFSNLGVFLFCMAGSIACFSALVLAADPDHQEFAKFLLAFGAIAFMLMADDFFLVHEIAESRLGIKEKWVFLAYAAAIGTSLIRFRAVIISTPYGYLFLSLSFFALSLLFDVLLDGKEDMVYAFKAGEKYLLEDGSKFLGIATWLFYLTVCSYDRIRLQRSTR